MTRGSRALFLVLCLAAAVGCARLGIWQFARLHERRASNARTLAQRQLPLIDLLDSTAIAGLDSSGIAQRRVMIRGSYDFGGEFVQRQQTWEGTPGVRIFTPLRPATGDSAVLVLRGFVPSPDATQVLQDSLREPESATVTGIALQLEPGSGGNPVARGPLLTWLALDRDEIRRRLPYPVRDYYIQQQPDSSLPAFPKRLELAPLDGGPHLSYAVQWFAFATIAVVGGGLVLWGKTDRKRD